MSMLLKGKAPSQLADALFWRTKIFCRRFFLPILRGSFRSRETSWIRNSGGLSYCLSPKQVSSILKFRPEIEEKNIVEAEQALGGWTEVPGFGAQKIDLSTVGLDNAAERYAHRLLCRLDFLRPLTRAALIAANPSVYLHSLESYIMEWERARSKPGKWDSVDESIRILNLLEAMALVGDRLKTGTKIAGLQCIIAAAWTVQANRARTGNHLIYESLALYYAGVCLPGYFHSRRWQRLGKQILENAIRQQVLVDGMNAELSTNYHLITGTNFLKAWVLSKGCDQEFTAEYRHKLVKMATVAAQLQCADQGFAALGDCDRLAGNSREEVEGRAFAELGRIFCGDQNPPEPGADLQMLLGGLAPAEISDQKLPHQDAIQSCGGYQIISAKNGGKLIFDTGSFGLAGASHHGHADSLSFEAQLSHCRFLVDPGGFSYVDEPARAYARSTVAHNTIAVDGLDSSEILGAFKFGRGARAQLLDRQVFAWGFLWVAEHDGYTRLASPVIHRRALIYQPQPFLLLIIDRLLGEGEHNFEVFFHADSGWEAKLEEKNIAFWRRNGTIIAQVCWSNLNLTTKLQVGVTKPRWQGFVSPAFGQYLPAPAQVEAGRGALPADIVNCFCQLADGVTPPILKGADYQLILGDGTVCDWVWDGNHLQVFRK